MGGNYEKGMYNQLTEVMARLDTIENELRTKKQEHRDDVDRLNRKIPITAGQSAGVRREGRKDIKEPL